MFWELKPMTTEGDDAWICGQIPHLTVNIRDASGGHCGTRSCQYLCLPQRRCGWLCGVCGDGHQGLCQGSGWLASAVATFLCGGVDWLNGGADGGQRRCRCGGWFNASCSWCWCWRRRWSCSGKRSGVYVNHTASAGSRLSAGNNAQADGSCHIDHRPMQGTVLRRRWQVLWLQLQQLLLL